MRPSKKRENSVELIFEESFVSDCDFKGKDEFR